MTTIKSGIIYALSSVAFILCNIPCFGQANTPTDSLLNRVRLHYNLQQPEKIYRNTSAEFHKKMTQFQFQEGMAKFYAKTGQWNSITFKGQTDKGWDYLCSFDKSDQIVSIKLDQDGKINRLNFAQVATQIPAKQEQVASNNSLKDSIDLHVERLVRPYIQKGNTCGITIAIIDRGNIYRYSYGSVNKLKEQLPDPELTIFEIGSVTKTFNALLLAKAVTAGKMKLEDPVNRYLPTDIPKLAFQGNPLKLIHLANHTSGLPRLPANIFLGDVNPADPYKHYTSESLYSFLRTYRPTTMPGKSFDYSNLGAGLLGTILERNSSQSFEQLIRDQITSALDMENTFVTLSANDRKRLAQGYDEQGKPASPWDLGALKGSGAIKSTLNDMIKYVRAQLGSKSPLERAIETSHQITFAGGTQDMALGWRINKGITSDYLHHSGGTGGFRSFVGFHSKKKFGIVILSNAAEDVTSIGEAFLSR